MRRITVFLMVLVFLAVSTASASSNGWISKSSTAQQTGPSFMDYYNKNKGTLPHSQTKPNKQGKKKKSQ